LKLKLSHLRLHKSLSISSLISGCTIGSISLPPGCSGLTASVPYEGEDDEHLTFSGGHTADLNRIFNSSFSATQIGKVFDEHGDETTVTLTPPPSGQKTVLANKKIYGVFKVTYIARYDKWKFSSNTEGPMLIFFIGSDT